MEIVFWTQQDSCTCKLSQHAHPCASPGQTKSQHGEKAHNLTPAHGSTANCQLWKRERPFSPRVNTWLSESCFRGRSSHAFKNISAAQIGFKDLKKKKKERKGPKVGWIEKDSGSGKSPGREGEYDQNIYEDLNKQANNNKIFQEIQFLISQWSF